MTSQFEFCTNAGEDGFVVPERVADVKSRLLRLGELRHDSCSLRGSVLVAVAFSRLASSFSGNRNNSRGRRSGLIRSAALKSVSLTNNKG